MIACTPIHPKIRNKLNAKMEVLGRTSPPANTETSTNKLKTEDVFTKSTFIRMTSHVASPMKPIILMGGELFDGKMKVGVDSSGGNANESITAAERSSIYGRSYGQSKVLPVMEDMKGKSGPPSVVGKIAPEGFFEGESGTTEKFRPMPGIKSLSVEYYGGLKTNRRGTVSWTCWSIEDLERLKTHFLKHGRHVLIEWGWSNNLEVMKTALKKDNYGDYRIDEKAVGGNIQKTIIDNEGDYDLMTGVISNFEWKTNTQGGFDCTTDIVGLGLSMGESTKQETKLTPLTKVVSKGWWSRWGEEDKEAVISDTVDANELYRVNASLSMGSIINILDEKIKKYHIGSEHAGKDEGMGGVLRDVREAEALAKGGNPDVIAEGFQTLGIPGVCSYKNGTLFTAQVKPQWKNVALASVASLVTGGLGVASAAVLPLAALEITGAWVTWGWFEDNILNKFLSMANDTEAVTSFRSIEVKIDETGENISDEEGNLQYESVRIKSHDHLLTQNVHRFIFPGLYPHSHTISSYNKYEALSSVIKQAVAKEKKGLKTFHTGEGVGFEQKGRLRDILIHVQVLKDIFSVGAPISLKNAMQTLADELNQEYRIWDFQIKSDEVNQGNMKVVDNNITKKRIDRLIDDDKDIFLFPAWQHNSFVKSIDMQSTVPNSMVLATMYGANVPVESVLGGADPDVDKKGFFLGGLSNDGAEDEKFKNLGIPYKKGVAIGQTDTGWKSFGNIDADPNKPLAKGAGIDLTLTAEEIKEGLQERIQKMIDDDPEIKKEVDEANEKYQAGYDDTEDTDPVPMNAWKHDGPLNKQAVYKDGIMRGIYLERLTDVLQGITGPASTTDLLVPIELSMSIDGVGGIFPGNVFRTSYIPLTYFDKTVFQLVEVNHEIGTEGWTVSLKGIMRMSWIKRYGAAYDKMLKELIKMEKELAAKQQHREDENMKREKAAHAKVMKESAEADEAYTEMAAAWSDIGSVDSFAEAVEEAGEAFVETGEFVVEKAEEAIAVVKHKYIQFKNALSDWWNN